MSSIATQWHDDPAQAHTAGRNDKSSLRRHMEDRPFSRDSAEPGRLTEWPAERVPRGRSGKSRCGNQKRGSAGLKYGSRAFARAKHGTNPVAARQKEQRKRYVRQGPAAKRYVKRSMKVPKWC